MVGKTGLEPATSRFQSARASIALLPKAILRLASRSSSEGWWVCRGSNPHRPGKNRLLYLLSYRPRKRRGGLYCRPHCNRPRKFGGNKGRRSKKLAELGGLAPNYQLATQHLANATGSLVRFQLLRNFHGESRTRIDRVKTGCSTY